MFRVGRLLISVLLSSALLSIHTESSYARSVAGPGQIQVHVPTGRTDETFSPATSDLPAATSSVGNTEVSSSATALDAAIASAPSGAVIHLTSGSYSRITDFTARDGWVTISGQGDRTAPAIAGADLWGAHDVRFVDVNFSAEVGIDHNPTLHYAQPAENVQILDSDVDCGSHQTSAGTTGVQVRGGSKHVTLSGDYVHNCVVGFASVAQDNLSSNIVITHSTFAHFPGDGMDLGGLSNVVISQDIIEDMADPARVFHDDGIQFFGNVHHVQITRDVLANSRNQLLFIQDAVAGIQDHTSVNSDILVAHNLIYGAGAVAIQDQGGVDISFIGNTMWSNHYGSLWLLKSGYTGISPEHTVIVDNIIQGFLAYESSPTLESHNLIVGALNGYKCGAGDLIANPHFVSLARGDFQLANDSPAKAAGMDYSNKVTGPAWPRDLFGHAEATRPAIGAFQPGDPTISYGAPPASTRYSAGS